MAPSCQRPFPACIQNFRGRTLWHYSSPLSIPTWRMALSPARECKKKERRNNLKWYLLQTFESKDKKICFLEKWNPIKFTRKSQKISENLKMARGWKWNWRILKQIKPEVFIQSPTPDIYRRAKHFRLPSGGVRHGPPKSVITHFFIFGFSLFRSHAMFPSILQKSWPSAFLFKVFKEFFLEHYHPVCSRLPFIATVREEIIVYWLYKYESSPHRRYCHFISSFFYRKLEELF